MKKFFTKVKTIIIKIWNFIQKIAAPLLVVFGGIFVYQKVKTNKDIKEEKKAVEEDKKLVYEAEAEVEKIEEEVLEEIEKNEQIIETVEEHQEQRKEDISIFLPGIKK